MMRHTGRKAVATHHGGEESGMFGAIDADRDSHLSASELTAYGGAHKWFGRDPPAEGESMFHQGNTPEDDDKWFQETMLRTLDTDGDGRISTSEFTFDEAQSRQEL
eukprot:SAG31_NODE_111_length_24443_cov_231.743685_7_plen_106_part_00